MKVDGILRGVYKDLPEKITEMGQSYAAVKVILTQEYSPYVNFRVSRNQFTGLNSAMDTYSDDEFHAQFEADSESPTG